MLSQTAGTRRAFRLALCLLFWLGSPGLAWASLTGLSGLDASRLPDLPSKLETAALEQREQLACIAFCGPALQLELETGPLAGRVPDRSHPFAIDAGSERLGRALFATELGSWVVEYANDNPTRFVDPTGHDNVFATCAAGGAICPGDVPAGQAEFAAANQQSVKNFVTGAAKEAGETIVGMVKHGADPKALLVPFPVRQSIDTLKGVVAVAVTVKENYKLVRDSPSGSIAKAAEELGPQGVAELFGRVTVRAGEVVAALAGLRAVAGEVLGGASASESALAAESKLVAPVEPVAPSTGSPVQLTAGRAWEEAELASLGQAKNTNVWRPSPEDINSAAFKVIVGPAKYTKGGVPMGTTVDIAETAGSMELKGGTKMMESSYQLRLQTYRALKMETPLTIRTTRPINPTFTDWLKRWGVRVENPSATSGSASAP